MVESRTPAARSGVFDGAGGLRLHYDFVPAAGAARATAVVLHGYADHAGRYAQVAAHLASAGIGALTFDFRGHGRSEGKRGHIDGFGEYVADLEAALAQARTLGGGAPVVIVAHSHGALIALHAILGGGARDVIALAMSSPYLGLKMKVSPAKTLAARITSRLIPRLTMANGIRARDLTHDQELVAQHERDGLKHGVATARWYTEATAAQGFVLAHVDRLSIPSLWMIAGADPLVDPEVSRLAYGRAGGPKTLIEYRDHFHENFNEVDRARVLGDLDSWLYPRLPRS
jgi:alpha-beta hydrolase superfamily lysophospholipase